MPEKKYDLFLIAILILGLTVFIVQLYFLSKANTLGARAAEYGALADNLLKGKGFTLDYIDQYYIKFDSVTHPLEWDYQLMGVLIAPFIWLFGKTALAAKLPTLIIGTILFPVLVYYLGKEFFDKKIGFLSAVSVLFYVRTFDLILNGQRDMAFAFFALAGIYFFYKGMNEDQAKYFYLMGIFLGLSYLVRQTILIIIPTLILAYYLIKKEFNLKLIKGMLVAGLVMSPWLIRNYLIFGDPLFTANKYAQWIFAWFPDYEYAGYGVYWLGGERLPSLSWLLSYPGFKQPVSFVIAQKIVKTFAVQLELLFSLVLAAFIGIVITGWAKIKKSLLIYIAFVILLSIIIEFYVIYTKDVTLLTTSLLALTYLGIVIIINFSFAKDNPAIRLFALLWLVFALFHGIFVFPATRFFLPLVPFFFIFTWAGANRVLELVSTDFKKFKAEYIDRYLIAFLLIFLLLNLPIIYQLTAYKGSPSWLPEAINNTTEKDSVIMACNVQSLNFFTGRKFVEVPNDRVNGVIEVLQMYNVSYITFSGCGSRLIDPKFYYAITTVSEVPQLHKKVLYKLWIAEGMEDENRVVNLTTSIVASVDRQGKLQMGSG